MMQEALFFFGYMFARLFIDAPFQDDLILDEDHFHYCFNVLRLNDGDKISVFNGLDGLFEGIIYKKNKKTGVVRNLTKIKDQESSTPLQLIFCPIKQDRLNFIIEKATELGVTDLYPIISQYTQVRRINPERLLKIAIEAAEQSERMDIPKIHQTQTLIEYIHSVPLQKRETIGFGAARSCLEKNQQCTLNGIIIGPEGGFSEKEETFLLDSNFTPLNFGKNILRAETAAIVGLDRIRLK